MRAVNGCYSVAMTIPDPYAPTGAAEPAVLVVDDIEKWNILAAH